MLWLVLAWFSALGVAGGFVHFQTSALLYVWRTACLRVLSSRPGSILILMLLFNSLLLRIPATSFGEHHVPVWCMRCAFPAAIRLSVCTAFGMLDLELPCLAWPLQG
jgi:hypothetical protein